MVSAQCSKQGSVSACSISSSVGIVPSCGLSPTIRHHARSSDT
jgi:hypothetical protein